MKIEINKLWGHGFYIFGIEKWDTNIDDKAYTEIRIKFLFWEICVFWSRSSVG